MRSVLRVSLTGAALLVLSACSRDAAPTASLPADLATLSIDPDVGATPGQASLPGFTMSPDNTYQGSVASSDQCAYSTTSLRVECAPVTRDGLTIIRSIGFYDAAGAPQTHRDSTTSSTNTRVAVKGTTTTTRGVFTVDRASSVTVTGLGRSSTAHTINGTETGTSSATLSTDNGGSAAVSETFSATTDNVIVPAPFTAASWPLSGTATRRTTLTASRGGTTRTSAQSEVVTFNGTATVGVAVTRDGTTRACTRNLTTHATTCP